MRDHCCTEYEVLLYGLNHESITAKDVVTCEKAVVHYKWMVEMKSVNYKVIAEMKVVIYAMMIVASGEKNAEKRMTATK